MLELNDVMLEAVSGGSLRITKINVNKNYAFVGASFNVIKDGGSLIVSINQQSPTFGA